MRGKADARHKDAETVLHAPLEIDGRRFFKIFRRAGDFSNSKAKHHGLRDHLIVEDEVVGVFENGKSLEQFAGKCTETGMVFRQLYAEEQVLECGQKAVGDVLVERHSAPQRAAAKDARREDHSYTPLAIMPAIAGTSNGVYW